MKVKWVHPFDVNREEMIRIQNKLKAHIEVKPLDKPARIITGADVSYDTDRAIGCMVTVDMETQSIIEAIVTEATVSTDYMPGLFAFRELPAILKTWEHLVIEPDLVIFDGNGMLHERRMGLATQASFWIEKPTIGIVKNPYKYAYDEPNDDPGAYSYIKDNCEIIGMALRTCKGSKPIFVSVGNRITLHECCEIALSLTEGNYRQCSVIRYANEIARKYRHLKEIGDVEYLKREYSMLRIFK